MPAALGRTRPPLPRFAVVWFPRFEGLERIEALRRRHDPVARHVAAHVSLVFPFPTSLTQLQIGTHVRRVVSRRPPILVTFRHARLHANEFLFLMASHGAEALTALHDSLYTRSLQPHLRRDMPFEPHITLARNADFATLEKALAESRDSLGGEYSDVLREVALLAVGHDGRINVLETISLNAA